jgi:hypothetical protein
MDLKIGKAEFTTPSLTQNEPASDDKVRALLAKIIKCCEDDTAEASSATLTIPDLVKEILALLDKK